MMPGVFLSAEPAVAGAALADAVLGNRFDLVGGALFPGCGCGAIVASLAAVAIAAAMLLSSCADVTPFALVVDATTDLVGLSPVPVAAFVVRVDVGVGIGN
mmetsp:Transcript_2112/g.6091  ORF Transcript_2112/g.6091 Transcript_2112/m.6091 type:complete len:101 (-) Transcript_2112:1140-1442(-)